jgi:DNA-binding transcriptional MerR regulator
MDISQVAKQSGIATSALRYYERQGLITSLNRRGARRIFAPTVIQQLGLIALGQAAGLSLDEIKLMLTPQGKFKIDRSLLSRKAREIDARVKQLRAVSRGLRHAAACPAPSHAECSTFQRLLKDAATGSLRQTETPLLTRHKRRRRGKSPSVVAQD